MLLSATMGIETTPSDAERRARDEAIGRSPRGGRHRRLPRRMVGPAHVRRPSPRPRSNGRRAADAPPVSLNSLRRSGTGTQEWLAPRLASLTVPTLALAGAKDLKFSLEAKAIALGVKHGSYDLIESTGHAAHLSQPLATAERVASFLNG
jgi:pimeloyl-ACP methyl ester carboxylesterase